MIMSDPIADTFTRVCNANTAKRDVVDILSSKMEIITADILVKEGYVTEYDVVENGGFRTIRITLKCGKDKNEEAIFGVKRISESSLCAYTNKGEFPKVLDGLGTAIVSTNQGAITDRGARQLGVGGEVLAFVR